MVFQVIERRWWCCFLLRSELEEQKLQGTTWRRPQPAHGLERLKSSLTPLEWERVGFDFSIVNTNLLPEKSQPSSAVFSSTSTSNFSFENQCSVSESVVCAFLQHNQSNKHTFALRKTHNNVSGAVESVEFGNPSSLYFKCCRRNKRVWNCVN